MADNACFFHGGELGLGDEELIRVKAMGLDEHRRSGVCEKMVGDLVSRWRCCKTIGRKDVMKIGKKIGDTLWGGEKSGPERPRETLGARTARTG